MTSLRTPLPLRSALPAAAALALLAGACARSADGTSTNQQNATSVLSNGGFETGDLTGWKSTGAARVGTSAHAGSYAAVLGSSSPTTDSSISQSFVVPSSGSLTFWYRVHCPDTVQYDWVTAALVDDSSGASTTVLAKTCTSTGAWAQVAMDLSAKAGRSMTLTITNHDDNYLGDPTYTEIDDVSVIASDKVPPTVAVTSPLDGATVSGSVKLVATATDNVGVTGIDLLVDGAVVGSGATSPATVLWDSGKAASGKHTITAVARDAAGNIGKSAAISVSVGGAGQTGIVNGGFETGTLGGWATTGSASAVTTSHSGGYAALVGSTNPGTDSSLSQTFTVPSGHPTLSFWYNVHCPDTVTYDWAAVTLADKTAGTSATLLSHTCSNTGVWVRATADLGDRAGHLVTLTLANHDDNYAGDATYTLYDDVNVATDSADAGTVAAITGALRLADGESVTYGSIHFTTNNGASITAQVADGGTYSAQLATGTYAVTADYTTQGFYGSNLHVADALAVTGDTTVNYTVHDVVLNATVVDPSGTPVPDVYVTGSGWAMDGGTGQGNISTSAGADGRLSVRVLPATYSLTLVPTGASADAGYVQSGVPAQTIASDTTTTMVVQRGVAASGRVQLADGEVPTYGQVRFYADTGVQYSAGLSDAGTYSLLVAPGTYGVQLDYSTPGYYGSGVRMADSLAVSTTALLDYTVRDIALSGRVVDSSGNPVANATVSGNGWSVDGGTGYGYLGATAGADGRFAARILPGQYSASVTPGADGGYVQTAIPSQTWTSDTSVSFVVQRGVPASGRVQLGDGQAPSYASVRFSSSEGVSYTATVADGGTYSTLVAPGTYTVQMDYSTPGYYASNLVVANGLAVDGGTTVNYAVPDVLLNGRVVDSTGTPVPGVTLTGQGWGGYDGGVSGQGSLSPTSGSDGRFSVRVLPETYSSVQLYPSGAADAGYVQTPLPDQTITAPTTKDFVIIGPR